MESHKNHVPNQQPDKDDSWICPKKRSGLGGNSSSWMTMSPICEAQAKENRQLIINQFGFVKLRNWQYLPSGKQTQLWKIIIFNRQTNYRWTIFNSYVKLQEGRCYFILPIPKNNMLPTKTHGFPPYVPFIQVWECGMWGA